MEKQEVIIKKNTSNNKRKIASAKQIKSFTNKNIIFKKDKLKPLTENNGKIKIAKIHRPLTSFSSTNININDYKYLFDCNNKETLYNAKWVLNLRVFDQPKVKKLNNIGEPTFYREDLEKFINKKKRSIQKSKSIYDFETLPYFYKYKHFFKVNNDNHGTYINKPLLNYNTSLRKNNIKILHKWNSNTNIKSNKYFYSCINLPKTKINDKYVMRPYKVAFTKEEYNGDKILKKEYLRDNNNAYNIFGDHVSLPAYNDKYSDKNYAEISDLLNSQDKTQSKTWYQIKLRNIINKNQTDKKIQNSKKKWKNY